MKVSAKKTIIIVDILNLYSLFHAIMAFRSVKFIHYLRKGTFADILAKLLTRYGWSFEPVQYSLSSGPGIYPFKELEKLMLDKTAVWSDRIFLPKINKLGISGYERTRLLNSFKRELGYEIYFEMQLFILFSVNGLFKDYSVKAVLLRKTLFSGVIEEAYRSIGLKVSSYRSVGAQFVPRHLFTWDKTILKARKSNINKVIKLVYCCLYSLACKIVCYFTRCGRNVKPHKICVLLNNSFGTELTNGLPWGAADGYLKEQTLALYNPFMPESAREFYIKRSDRFVEYNLNARTGCMDAEVILSWAHYVDCLCRNIWLYGGLFGFRKINRWMSRHLWAALTGLSFFEALFSVNGCKIVWFVEAEDTQTQFAAMAINRLGGISLGTSGSHAVLLYWSIQNNRNDVYFVWGKRFADIRNGTGDQCDSFVFTGYPMDAAFTAEFERGRDLRNLIAGKYRARNILTFFDSGSWHDQWVVPEQIFNMYEVFFKWLDEDEHNFLIIKAKASKTVNKYPELKGRIDRLCAENRICVLGAGKDFDGRKTQKGVDRDRSAFYPGLAADAVVSHSPTLSSVTALFGRPLIFYDIQNTYQEYPFGIEGVRVVSGSEEMLQAIRDVTKNGPSEYPEEPAMIKGSAIDPFADGKAAARMRGYITSLLKTLDEGRSNAEAVYYANAEHEKKWGAGTVMKGPLAVK